MIDSKELHERLQKCDLAITRTREALLTVPGLTVADAWVCYLSLIEEIVERAEFPEEVRADLRTKLKAFVRTVWPLWNNL
jgi:hypothetical protein